MNSLFCSIENFKNEAFLCDATLVLGAMAVGRCLEFILVFFVYPSTSKIENLETAHSIIHHPSLKVNT